MFGETEKILSRRTWRRIWNQRQVKGGGLRAAGDLLIQPLVYQIYGIFEVVVDRSRNNRLVTGTVHSPDHFR